MKHKIICILSAIGLAITNSAMGYGQTTTYVRKPLPTVVKLSLETTLTRKEYCSTAPYVQLYFSLKFTNRGNKPIIIDRQSYRISRDMVSRDIQRSTKKKYVQNGLWNLDYAGAGFTRKAPSDITPFIILKPGESFVASDDRHVNLLFGVPERESLQAGTYFLQVRVITWYYHDYAAIDRLRTEWQDRGYLWSDDVTSDPMAFELDRKPNLQPCTIRSAK